MVASVAARDPEQVDVARLPKLLVRPDDHRDVAIEVAELSSTGLSRSVGPGGFSAPLDTVAPAEVGAWVPPMPARMMDHRPNRARVIQSADVFVDAGGLIYSTDYNAGLFILEYRG